MKRLAQVLMVALALTAASVAGATPAFATGVDRPSRPVTRIWLSIGKLSGQSTWHFFGVSGPTIGFPFVKGTAVWGGDVTGGDFPTTTTAANGDTITGTGSFRTQGPGTADPTGACPTDPPAAFAQYQRITGGTGRFTGATGKILVRGCRHATVDGHPGGFTRYLVTLTFTAVGWISY